MIRWKEKVITSSCSINRLARLLSSFIIIIFAILIWFSAFLCAIFTPWSLERQKGGKCLSPSLTHHLWAKLLRNWTIMTVWVKTNLSSICLALFSTADLFSSTWTIRLSNSHCWSCRAFPICTTLNTWQITASTRKFTNLFFEHDEHQNWICFPRGQDIMQMTFAAPPAF